RGARPWFLNERLSGGLILDCMIHDLNLLVTKYGLPSVRSAVGRSHRYGVVDEALVRLAFDGFEAEVGCTWTAERTDAPIVTTVKWRDAGGTDQSVLCSDYAIRSQAAPDDPFLLELQAFLDALQTGMVPYPL